MWWEIDANTSCAFCLACLIALHWLNKSSISQVIYFFESHTYPATRIVPPPRVLWSVELHQDNQARFVIPIYYVLTDQGGKLSCTWESFLLILNSYFLPLRTLFRCLKASESNLCLLKLKSTHPHWIYPILCLVCLGVGLYVFGRQ